MSKGANEFLGAGPVGYAVGCLLENPKDAGTKKGQFGSVDYLVDSLLRNAERGGQAGFGGMFL